MELPAESQSLGKPVHPQILLYQELLECLEQERQALTRADEEAILSQASLKILILERLQGLDEAGHPVSLNLQEATTLQHLRRQAAAAHHRNHVLITASLEVVQEFLGQLLPQGTGTYGPPGPGGGFSGQALFHRRA